MPLEVFACDDPLPAVCVDCGTPAWLGHFTGSQIVQLCEACAVERSHGPVPAIRLPADGTWILGHAAQTNCAFRNEPKDRVELFARGAFRRAIGESVAFGVNHACAPGHKAIDWSLTLASTCTDSLAVAEDLYGLLFLARVRRDACVAHGDGVPLNIHDAIAAGTCVGLSVYGHGGDRAVGPTIPSEVFVYARLRLMEISLVVPPLTACGSPGTWVMRAGPAAMACYMDRVRSAATPALQES